MAKAETPTAPLTMLNGWPVDPEGVPMALITMGASEKIGMPNYSNVDLGPASVSKFVYDDRDAIAQGLKEIVDVCEQVIGEERGKVIEVVKAAMQTGSKPGT